MLLASPVAAGIVTIELNDFEEITVDIEEKALPEKATGSAPDDQAEAEIVAAEAVS